MNHNKVIEMAIEDPIAINGIKGAIILQKTINKITKTNTIVKISIKLASSCACVTQTFVTYSSPVW